MFLFSLLLAFAVVAVVVVVICILFQTAEHPKSVRQLASRRILWDELCVSEFDM